MIRFDKFTQKAQEALQQSQEVAGKSDGQVLYPLHLLVALAQEREGIVRPVLEKCGVQPDAIVPQAADDLLEVVVVHQRPRGDHRPVMRGQRQPQQFQHRMPPGGDVLPHAPR